MSNLIYNIFFLNKMCNILVPIISFVENKTEWGFYPK